MLDTLFKHKKVNIAKMTAFGFIEENGVYRYTTELLNGQFRLFVELDVERKLTTKLIDTTTQDIYTLHLVASACGTFVGSIRTEYENVLTEICERCYDKEIFKSEQAHALIQYVRETYGDEPEYLWQKFPDNAIWRRKDNRKWYGALLTVSQRKLGIDSDEPVEIVDLRIEPKALEALIDGERYFPGYHMNKKHWFTMRLDGSVPFEEICKRLEESYRLAKK